MSSSNLLKNLMSKDINQMQKTVKNILNNGNAEDFKELSENADFIFPFIKEKIVKNFIKLVEENHLETVFKFSEIYSSDFEDIIVNSWIKFANEDLTDRILELFENGTNEQKAYCAKYFSKINDTLSLDYLEKYAFSNFEPLKINCAIALNSFRQEDILYDMENIIKTSESEFDKLEAYKFLCAYNSKKSIDFVVNNFTKSPFKEQIVLYLFDYYNFKMLKDNYDISVISQIFCTLLEGYPENIGLETIEYYGIYDFIEYLLNNTTPFTNNLLALAKLHFEEYLSNGNYNFNLDKSIKNELKEIVNLLKNFEPVLDESCILLDDKDFDNFKITLKVIEEYKLAEYSNKLGDLFNSPLVSLENKAYIAQTLKILNKQNLILQETVNEIQNQNIKVLIESLMV